MWMGVEKCIFSTDDVIYSYNIKSEKHRPIYAQLTEIQFFQTIVAIKKDFIICTKILLQEKQVFGKA
jgi:hypothetical protein